MPMTEPRPRPLRHYRRHDERRCTSGGYAMSIRFLLALSLSGFACGGQPAAPDDTTTTRFVGRWIYQPGSAVVADCPNAPPQTIDLSKVPPDNQPAYFTFTATAVDRLH